MSDADLYQWFAQGLAASPDAVAVRAEGAESTYRELARSADAVASRVDQKTKAGLPVAVMGDRTISAYANYLGVLRAGRTVVPLNPSFPAARTETIVRASAVSAVLTQNRCISVAARAGDASCFVPPHDAAYVLFTSGTTGDPKGIPISHANVEAFMAHTVPDRGMSGGDRASQAFDLTFDPSVFDMFTTWAAGATLVVPSREELQDPVQFVGREQITHWASVPSLISLARRMRSLDPGAMPTLRNSTFAGEALTLDQAAAWQRAAPQGAITNAYGPTEMTITCIEYTLPRDTVDWPQTSNGTVPIGVPYPHVSWRIDKLVSPLDPSAAARSGELLLSGPQRTSGYLDPPVSAGRFVDGYYRTGDNVRVEDDVGLVHLGRLDDQVQLNGYRVELSEVEGAIRNHEQVDDVVVVLDHGCLVAMCTGNVEDADNVLDAIAEVLPPYMVPQRLMRVECLPLNANGKIDRQRVTEMMG